MAWSSLSSSPRSPAQSGFILVAVLWMIAALGALASVYSVYAANTAAASHVPDDRLQAEQAIRAGVELAVYRVSGFTDAQRPTHGTFTTRVGSAVISVRYVSEAARIDLNAAPKALLAGLFSSIGIAPAVAAGYAERIVSWRTKSGPTDPSGSTKIADLAYPKSLAYPERKAPFNNPLELSLVPGLPSALVERLLPEVTVYSGAAQVDILDAAPEVLAAMPEMSPASLGAVLKARASDPDDIRAVLQAGSGAPGTLSVAPSKTMRAYVSVRLPRGRRIEAQVVFRVSDPDSQDSREPQEPYDLLYWRDDFDGPL